MRDNPTAGHYVYVWTFQVKPGFEAQFEKTYGPAGEWVRLFEKAPGYLRTELLKDKDVPGRYLTIDHWESELSHQQFRQRLDGDFRQLDQFCEGLTDAESLIGHFVVVGPRSSAKR
jgi:heme-degrading monooxygenase HmoA